MSIMMQSRENSFAETSNDLYVPIEANEEESKSADKLTQTKKQCRICLEGQNQGRIMRPCHCLGSVTYAHEHCLVEWILRKHDPKIKMKVRCELCKQQFQYKVCKSYKLSCETFVMNMRKEKCHFITFFVVLIFLLLGIIFVSLIISKENDEDNFGQVIRNYLLKSENMKIVYICTLFFVIIFMVFLVVLFLTEYAVKSQLKIGELMEFQPKKIKKTPKIYPQLILS